MPVTSGRKVGITETPDAVAQVAGSRKHPGRVAAQQLQSAGTAAGLCFHLPRVANAAPDRSERVRVTSRPSRKRSLVTRAAAVARPGPPSSREPLDRVGRIRTPEKGKRAAPGQDP